MWGKSRPKSEPLSFNSINSPPPRPRQKEQGMEIVLSFVERVTGKRLSTLDAEVLVMLIKSLKRKEAKQDGPEEQRSTMSVLRECDDAGNAEQAIPAGQSNGYV